MGNLDRQKSVPGSSRRARARWLIAINAVLLVLLGVGVALALSYGRFGGG